jgi:hypothetical protein
VDRRLQLLRIRHKRMGKMGTRSCPSSSWGFSLYMVMATLTDTDIRMVVMNILHLCHHHQYHQHINNSRRMQGRITIRPYKTTFLESRQTPPVIASADGHRARQRPSAG